MTFYKGNLSADSFSGVGSSLTNLNASNIASGTLPAGRFDDTSHGNRSGGSLHALATTSLAGFMSAADKTALNNYVSTGGNPFDQSLNSSDSPVFYSISLSTILNAAAIQTDSIVTGDLVANNVYDVNYYVKTTTYDWNWYGRRYTGATPSSIDLWNDFYNVDEAPASIKYIHTNSLDSNTNISGPTYWGDVHNYHCIWTTYIHVNRQFTLTNVSFGGDDQNALYINNKKITSYAGNGGTNYTYTFNRGWHKIDMIYCEIAGGHYVSLGWNPKNYLAYIDAMTPFGPTDLMNSEMIYFRDGKAGFGTATPTERVEVSGNVKATSFIGNGSSITGLTSTQVGLGNVQNVDTTNAANITSGVLNSARIPALPYLSVNGGTLNGSLSLNDNNITNVGSLGLDDGSSISSAGNAGITYIQINSSENSESIYFALADNDSFMLTRNAAYFYQTVNAPSFSGNGSALTGLTKAQIGLGNVANVDTTNASNITSGTLGTARMGSGTANSTTYLRGDGTWQSVPVNHTQNTDTGTTATSFQIDTGNSGPRIKNISGVMTVRNAADSANSGLTASAFIGDGSGLTGLTKTQVGLGNVTNIDTTNASNITTGTLGTARMGSGTPSATTYLRGDGTWQAISGISHTQNTDTGTTATSFQIDSGNSGPRIKNLSGVLTVRDGADSTNANFAVASLSATGTIFASLFSGSGASLTGLSKNQVGLGNVQNVDTTNASNITTGTLPIGQVPNLSTIYLPLTGGTLSGQTRVITNAPITDSNASAQIIVKNTSTATGGGGTGHAAIVIDKGLDSASAAFGFLSAGISKWDAGITDDNDFHIRDTVNNRKIFNLSAGAPVNSLNVNSSGVVSGSSFSGVGTSLTALNASNLTSGTVATARLGSGTANSTTYLRGDSTWQPLSGISHTQNTDTGTTSTTFQIDTGNSGPKLKNISGVLTVRNASDSANAALTASAFTGDGSAITGINASNISSGTLNSARIPTLPYLKLDGSTPIAGNLTFNNGTYWGSIQYGSGGSVYFDAPNGLSLTGNTTVNGSLYVGSGINGDGSNITNINASNVSSGVISPARLGSGTANSTTYLRGDGTWQSVPVNHTQNTDTGTTSTSFQIDSGNSGPRIKNIGGVLTVRNAADSANSALIASAFAGDGSSITGLTANFITTGTLPSARFTDISHGNRGGGQLHATATSTNDGFMSADDKALFDVVSGNGFNPFDQSLNTGNDVNFNSITISQTSSFQSDLTVNGTMAIGSDVYINGFLSAGDTNFSTLNSSVGNVSEFTSDDLTVNTFLNIIDYQFSENTFYGGPGELVLDGPTSGNPGFRSKVITSFDSNIRILNPDSFTYATLSMSGGVLSLTADNFQLTAQIAGDFYVNGTTTLDGPLQMDGYPISDVSSMNISNSLDVTGAIVTGLTKNSVGLGNVQNFDTTNASNITTGTINPSRLGSGTPSSTTYLRGDGTWATVAAGHIQNTDTGTTATSFQIDSGNNGPRIKNVSGVLNVRNVADSDFAGIQTGSIQTNSTDDYFGTGNGSVRRHQAGNDSWFGIYDSGGNSYYGLRSDLGATISNVVALGGFYSGMAIKSKGTLGDSNPWFAVLPSNSGNFGVGYSPFSVQGNYNVTTFHNTLDSPSGNANFSASLNVSGTLGAGYLSVSNDAYVSENLTVDGGTLYCNNGIYVNGGTLDINGGDIYLYGNNINDANIIYANAVSAGYLYATNILADSVAPVVISKSTGTRIGTRYSVRSNIVNFKTVADTQIFTVPAGYMFLIDTMEVLTITSTSPGTAPTVRFGNTSISNAYFAATVTSSNAVGSRHIVDNPQDGIVNGTILTAGVTVASTATIHTGVFIITGQLIATS